MRRALLAFAALAATVSLHAQAATTAGPCGLLLNPPQRGEIPFRTPQGGHAIRRLLAGRFLLCTLKRRDGTLFAKLHSDSDERVLGVAFYRRNGHLLNAVDASYEVATQAPAEVSCGSSAQAALGSKYWRETRKWWIGTTAPGLNPDTVVQALRNAESEWTRNINYCGIKDTGKPPSDYQGRTQLDAGTKDGKSVEGFGAFTNDQDCSAALACTMTWYDDQGNPIESDIRFNTEFKWSTNGAPGMVDIQTIAAHELGHVLQFDHVTSSGGQSLLMWPYFTSGDTSGRKLGKGEALGDNSHY